MSKEKRKWRYSSLKIFFIFVIFMTFFSRSAYAYIDPGFGALVWQALLAFIFGAMFFFKSEFQKIRAKFSRSSSSETASSKAENISKSDDSTDAPATVNVDLEKDENLKIKSVTKND